MKKKCHFLVGTRWFGVLGPTQLIIDELIRNDYEVFVFGQEDEHYQRYFKGQCKLVKLRMRRSYGTILSDALDVLTLIYYLIRYRPENVHSFNPKPALISAMSVLFFPGTKFFIGVTGLGNTFIRAPRLEPFIKRAIRWACKRSSYVFFQNQDDIELFVDGGMVEKEKALIFIGPGVDLRVFKPAQVAISAEQGTLTITCVARLIWQKGIREYVEMARVVRAELPDQKFDFLLVGEVDLEHPDCIDPKFVADAHAEGTITHIAWTDDIVSILQRTQIFVLHSYREGAPRAILEASACHLPTVGSDAIGVRELVVDGETGFLTKLQDVGEMVVAVKKLVVDPDLREQMGARARAVIGEPFSLVNSSRAQLDMYNRTGAKLEVTITD
ncbi:glycosyltransferase [Myxococcota bacterium]|nr:glycosyltransferase [Myxococcota bacterium]